MTSEHKPGTLRLLRTIKELYGLPPLGRAAKMPPLSTIWKVQRRRRESLILVAAQVVGLH